MSDYKVVATGSGPWYNGAIRKVVGVDTDATCYPLRATAPRLRCAGRRALAIVVFLCYNGWNTVGSCGDRVIATN